ncbi:hypothetical protein [Calothrix sp. UHCC 0171]|nr:hypothetical protein [Calothrix sp. UHCC 0171]MEA5571598.1 hypothetical protein [Calothrix sp. UHCC 0171]
MSNKPSICRDLSIVTGVDTEIEDICEEIVKVLGNEVELRENI